LPADGDEDAVVALDDLLAALEPVSDEELRAKFEYDAAPTYLDWDWVDSVGYKNIEVARGWWRFRNGYRACERAIRSRIIE
jgi:hypothetical protein